MMSPSAQPPLAFPAHTKVKKQHRYRVAALYTALPLLVFIFTSIPGINTSAPIVALGILTLLLVTRFLPRQLPRNLMVGGWTLFVLLLVGASGWFFSAFFFALYLAAIALGFIYTPVVAVGFTLGLLLVFASSIGEVSPTADFLVLLSLLSVIPITIALRRSFLLVQQERKGILILESDEQQQHEGSALDAILTNQVNKIAIVLRQPITYVRQGLALLKANALTPEEYPGVIDRMSRAADEIFTLIKEFESETTKNTLVSRGKTIEKPKK